ncbi:MAG TPA: mechanosensitive ion channel family protein [Aggregatilinea sp.]|jgi:small-conductance mechanosensitive channel|uniref:mechanosensitive ion channel family protein n=1 Tax=Aggregatilinea sp. TaxID=2806333 RepID=UPI002C7BA06B|nr:mechanosensitive ion channel family protein [Aggregatilinea sp.]HML23641.1 mechanosensitive ion channel family protein [Aggregatilinea sp.]
MEIDFSEAIKQLQGMINGLIRLIPNILVAVLVFFLFYAASRWVRLAVIRVSDRTRRSTNLGLVLGRLSQWFTVLMGILIASVIVFPNFSPAQVIQLLGIGSVAIGFAFRDILQNFLSGILLLLTEPFRIGDQIVVDDYEGTVEEIQTRATTIRTYDGRRVVIPNAELYTGVVMVNTAFEVRRLEYDVGIGYGDDVDEAKSIILDVLKGLDEVLDDPAPDVLVFELADFSVVLRVRWWIQPPRKHDALDSRDRVLSGIKHKLLTHGIDLPFPTHQLLFHDQTETSDGSRTDQREGWPAGRSHVPGPRRPPDASQG